jgi:hypothetical protein
MSWNVRPVTLHGSLGRCWTGRNLPWKTTCDLSKQSFAVSSSILISMALKGRMQSEGPEDSVGGVAPVSVATILHSKGTHIHSAMYFYDMESTARTNR